MKTTYIAFAVTNLSTHNFVLGTVKIEDEKLLNKIKQERISTQINPTLRDYVIEHSEDCIPYAAFTQTLKYFHNDNFEAKLLGVYLEEEEAKHRIQLAIDSYIANFDRKVYYNECFNLKEHLVSEEVEQQKLIELKENLVKENALEQGIDLKSASKKQSITIVETESGVEHQFSSKSECMKYLNCASDTFSRFLKGNTKLNKKYTVKQ